MTELRNYYGQLLYKIDRNDIMDFYYRKLYFIDNNDIKEYNSRKLIYRIKGDEIQDFYAKNKMEIMALFALFVVR